MENGNERLVIVGTSQILSDLVDCALERGMVVGRLLVDEPPQQGERDLALADRLALWERFGVRPEIGRLDSYVHSPGEVLILGPTTPRRQGMVRRLEQRLGALPWLRLVHPAAQVSRMATLGPGCFVGAGAVIAPGASLGEHVFVNRCAAIGHDTRVGDYTRIQPHASLGGLSEIGPRVTIGMGAAVFERLRVGADCTVGGGTVVRADLPAGKLVAGNPARIVKNLTAAYDA